MAAPEHWQERLYSRPPRSGVLLAPMWPTKSRDRSDESHTPSRSLLKNIREPISVTPTGPFVEQCLYLTLIGALLQRGGQIGITLGFVLP